MATITVTTLADSTATDGQVSLREAIQAANTNASVDGSVAGSGGTPDTIVFDPTVFTGGATNLIRLTLGEIAISGAVTIDGSTVGGVTITGDKDDDDVTLAGTDITDVAASGAALLDDNSRIFNIAAVADTTLQSLTLTGGRTTASGGGGGGVLSQSALTLTNSTVSGNSTTGFSAKGGGIAGDIVTLTDSTVSGNSTAGTFADGGGIMASNTVTLTNSTVSGNATTGSQAFGGGILASTVELTNSTVSGNSTAGIFSTGGGIHAGTVELTNSTVSGNSTAGFAADGGGVFSLTAVTLTNAIVLGNNSAQTTSDEISGAITANGLNIVGTGADTDASDHIINADPVLVFAQTVANGATMAGVLASNGGPVPTIALKLDAANPALDASNTSAPGTDARGLGYVDQPAITNANGSPADLGAFEAGELPSLVVTTKDDVV
ncbi:MAG TPA: right-handed parallel beta-helix repeat-containing protein, partial [Xanthobacteraceae bacterium]|nr:right-handed parallel beta-helix repeat-containing protein [Xanthobacteraceae bacterium]